jgi:hypothetical protein
MTGLQGDLDCESSRYPSFDNPAVSAATTRGFASTSRWVCRCREGSLPLHTPGEGQQLCQGRPPKATGEKDDKTSS